MKMSLLSISALSGGSALWAADPSSLVFRAQPIEVPPLALGETIERARVTKPFQFDAGLLAGSSGANSIVSSPTLLPRKRPNLAQLQAAAAARKPHLSPGSRMPVIEPGTAIDYKMAVQAPDLAVDFKMIVKEPATELLK